MQVGLDGGITADFILWLINHLKPGMFLDLLAVAAPDFRRVDAIPGGG